MAPLEENTSVSHVYALSKNGELACSCTCSVFADEVVFGFTVVVVPLEHVEPSESGGSGRLVIHHHTHLVATRWLVPVPVPGTQTRLMSTKLP